MNVKKIDMSNEEIVCGIKHSSQSAFEYIYFAYYDELYSFAYHYIMSKDDAKDIIQDVFINLWKMASNLPENINIRGYLYNSVKNSCFNFLNRHKIFDKNLNKLIEAIVFTYSSNDDVLIEEDDLQSRIDTCLKSLTSQQQEVLKLKIDGMSYNDIARTLNISGHTVHIHIKNIYNVFRSNHSVFKDFVKMFIINL